MSFPEARAVLARLPADPPLDDLRPVARQLALSALQAQYPAKSLAAFQRHREAEGIAADLLRSVMQLAHEELEILERTQQPVDAPPPSGRWIGAEAAASALNLSMKALTDWLEEVQGRMRLGWPWWDGHRWRIAEPAINPSTRATYMATLPLEEPALHVATLPAWCKTS